MTVAIEDLYASVPEAYKRHCFSVLGRTVPPATSASELFAAVAQLAAGLHWERERGWTSDPPFPGAVETPVQLGPGVWKIAATTRLSTADGTPFATIVSTFVSGRLPALAVRGPEIPVPNEWRPVAPKNGAAASGAAPAPRG